MSKSGASKARLVITAITLENRTVAEVVADYTVSRSWVYELLARYRAEGHAALEPRSRRPKTSPNATPAEGVDLVLQQNKDPTDRGLDAGPDTIGWHLRHRHQVRMSRATIHRILSRAGTVTPNPRKRPRCSYLRFEAAMPNETWQSDFTHYRLTRPDGSPGADTEIISWLDDHSRYALHVTAHQPVTAKTVLNTFRQAADLHGYPASTLTGGRVGGQQGMAGGRYGGGLQSVHRRVVAALAHCGALTDYPNRATSHKADFSMTCRILRRTGSRAPAHRCERAPNGALGRRGEWPPSDAKRCSDLCN